MNETSYFAIMERKLKAALTPIVLEIKDDSARHLGHAGHDPRGETHFSMYIVSNGFDGLSTLERHRLVYKIVADEMKERVHALSLKTSSPTEQRE